MKLKSLLFTTVLAVTPWLANAQEGKKADLQDVTKNLDMDGQFFMANNIEGDLGKLAALGSDYVKTARENGSERFPSDMDFNAILKDMGMDQLLAYGRSAKFAEDHWVNKMYVQNNGSRKGIFSLMGKSNTPYEVIKFAPAGTDLVMEWSVDTRQLMSSMKSVPRCEKMNKFLSRKLPSGENMEAMLKKFTAKMSLAVKLDDEKREVCPIYPEYTFPKMHGVMRMEGANQIWNQVGKMAGFMMKLEKQDDGTLLMTPHKQKKGMNVVMLMDTENDTLWVATSPEFLTECRGDGAKLSADADFKAISDGVTKGKAIAYISQQACLEIRQVKEAKLKKKGKKCLSDEMMQRIMDHLTESKNGYFAEVHQSKKGINYVLKAPCPIKEVMCGKPCGRKKGCSSYKKGCDKGCDKDCDKGCKSCDKDKSACSDSGCTESSKKGDAKQGCGCEAGECKCGKDKSSCKCEGSCKCEKDESKAKKTKKAKPAEKPEPADDFTKDGDQGVMK